MTVQHFEPQGRKTVNWASGTSTEIFIHPPEAGFAERNFIFRISTATVEAEESTFTFFGGITRHLMILKGELELIHEGHYTKRLKPYDQDTFSGEWKTSSKGRVTDFNLMLKDGARGSLEHWHLAPGEKRKVNSRSDYDFVFIAGGELRFDNDNIASAGDLLMFEKNSTLELTAKKPCDVILIKISLASSL